MIDAIFFENFKGRTEKQNLTGRDIFIGPNGSGKTSRIQALGLAMLGYVPGNGKTEAETFKLATGQEMRVGVHTNGGFGFERRFAKSEDYNRKNGERTVKISQAIEVAPGRGEANDTQRRARIAEEIGSFPVMLDFNEFLSLSDAKRRAFFYSLSPAASAVWGKDQVHGYLIETLLTDTLQQNNPEHFQVMQDLITEVMTKYPDGASVSDGLQAMIDWVTPRLKTEKGKKQDAQGAVRQLADAKNSLAETDRNIAVEKTELEELQAKLVEVEKQISKDTERKRIIDERNWRIEELRKAIAEAEAAPVDAPDVAEIDQKLAELRGQLKEADTAQGVAELNARLTDIDETMEVCRSRKDALQGEIIQIDAGVATLKQSLETINGLGGVCVIDRRIACEKDFSKYRGWVEQKLAEAEAHRNGIQSKINDVATDLNKWLAEKGQTQQEINRLISEAQQTNSLNTSLNAQISTMERQRNEALNAGERRQNQITLYRDELTRLMNEPAVAIAPIDILEKQAEGIRTRISTLKASVEEKTKARQTIVLMQQSSLENRTAELKAACLKSMSEALGPKGIQGELVKEILDPIRGDIRANLEAMGFYNEPFFETESETGKEIFQFGWVNAKGHRVNFDALSTGEQAIFLAAMMTVIITRANPKLKILVIDNLNHLDSRNLQLVVNGLSLLSEQLDNIILAGAIECKFEAPGWRVWNLGQVGEASDVA
ncbi:MAG: hypothetical protein ACM3X6_02985 [Patescibacteria group bacterium]